VIACGRGRPGQSGTRGATVRLTNERDFPVPSKRR
jgi:hypothetical protein